MKSFIFTFTCFVALLVPVAVLASSGDGFDGIVRSIETKYHVHATRIPFMGLVSSVGHVGSHGGVSNMHVAEFDDFSAKIDGEDLNRMVQEKLGPEWSRMVRETSKHGAEQTLVYVHPEGKRMGMFVLDADGSELDVVQMSVDPGHLNQQLSQYGHHDDSGASD
ncbi:MAG: hypothetical protein ACLGSD_15655 [Acidobacteriota bacterium]